MRYKTNDIPEGGLGVDVPLTEAWLGENCGDLGARLAPGGLRLRGRLEPTGDDFLLRGKLKGALEFTCVKCLEPTRLAVDVDVAVSYVEGPEEDRAKPTPPGDEDEDEGEGDFITFQDGVIDLGPEIRDEIFLAVPYSPKCEPECLGICPMCGVNRDKTPCTCEEQQNLARSPFADLAKLKKS